MNGWMHKQHHSADLKGLERQCPWCGEVAHYDVEGRKPVEVVCPLCEEPFTVQKYRRGERPKPTHIKLKNLKGE